MSMISTQISNKKRIETVLGQGPVEIKLCIVIEVDSSTFTASVAVAETGVVVTNVPFCMPFNFADGGIMFIPERGALALLGTTTKQEPFILGFVSFSTLGDIIEDIAPGEMLLQSRGYGFAKIDNNGNVILKSLNGNSIIVGGDGDNYSSAITSINKTVSREMISGVVSGVVAEIERIYDRQVVSSIDTEEIIRRILDNKIIPLEAPDPIVVIEKGNAVDPTGQKITLDVLETSQQEICYRISVYDINGGLNFALSLDKDGNARMTGRKLLLDFENVVELDRGRLPNWRGGDGS